jgi:lipoyl(octanoyl) transferase
MSTVRLLPFESLSGVGNMAADEAMLESAERGVASFRFYTWTEPTLSLGYFQPSADRHSRPTSAWVRRSTGGAGILHDPAHELTYSFALPPGETWQPKEESWLCRFHHLLQESFRVFGVETRAVVCGEEQKLGPVMCFLHQTPADLLANGAKVVGSAQRKLRGCLLQHGSILLSRSPLAPELPGIAELAGKRVDVKRLQWDVVKRVGDAFDWRLSEEPWTVEELAERERIEREKYGTAEWNEKR